MVDGVEQASITTEVELLKLLTMVSGWKITILVVHPDPGLIGVLWKANCRYIVMNHQLEPQERRENVIWTKIRTVLKNPKKLLLRLERKKQIYTHVY